MINLQKVLFDLCNVSCMPAGGSVARDAVWTTAISQ